MFKKLLFGITIAALAMANAAEIYRVRFFRATVLNGAQLKPGEYQVMVAGEKAVFQQGKETAESPVKVEKEEKKFDTTIFKYDNKGGAMHLIEICVGGTNTKLSFNPN